MRVTVRADTAFVPDISAKLHCGRFYDQFCADCLSDARPLSGSKRNANLRSIDFGPVNHTVLIQPDVLVTARVRADVEILQGHNVFPHHNELPNVLYSLYPM